MVSLFPKVATSETRRLPHSALNAVGRELYRFRNQSCLVNWHNFVSQGIEQSHHERRED